ncbi:autoinducer binding domain-containing protein [Tropicimonas sp. IMCC34011]|uniref:autoinducer binding domain-containing protein n=1 Tax=Tropicimonas sp. IMCC34011 TaxID=2248759 RepID=UPI000E24C5EF|nr:autoinducer binding domain-containing protein [Tropicimonas sp. IMCC34011]
MPGHIGIERELEKLGKMAPEGYHAGLHIRFVAPLITASTYRQEWVDHYTARGYALRDPMIAWGFSTEGSARWSALGIPDPFGILDEAASFGLRYGCVVSRGPLSSRTIVGCARSDREYHDDEIAAIEGVVTRLHAITEPPEKLTQAQKEALRLIAAGHRHAAAAAKLDISESALKARLTSARERLMARTTAEAIQRAQENRLI